MKKIISILLLAVLLMSLSVLAAPAQKGQKTLDSTDPLGDKFDVYLWFSQDADSEVVVLTVKSGASGYVVIKAGNEQQYAKGLKLAKQMIKAKPNQIHGTKFAYLRERI